MKVPVCTHEKDVLSAVNSGRWGESLRAHALGCPTCQEVVSVSRYLQTLAACSESEPPLPNPGQIWWRAQRLERQAMAAKAIRPILIFQNVALMVATLLLFGLLVWSWPEVDGWLTGLKQTWLQVSSLFGSRFTALYLLSMALGVFCLTLIVSLYTVFTEE